MALSFKACFVFSCTPFAQNRTSQKAMSSFAESKSNFNTQNWSIPQNDHSLASRPLRHPRYLIEHRRNVDEDFDIEHVQKLESFKHILMKQGGDSFESLSMIDAIQRLGIDYLFQEEIGTVLARHYLSSNNNHGDNDLHEVALRFRLLRQQGYHVSSGVFDNFKDKSGKFKKKISADVKGLMSLYEASQLSIRGEDELDEAGNYSYQLLNSIVTHLDYNTARLARNTLSHPHHKSLTSSMDNKFVDELNVSNAWINVLKDFAKAEFKMVQSQHQHEMIEIAKWWKDLGLSKELKFARDQPLKWYMWSMSCLTDPNLSEQRIELTKPISMIYIIDDIFDVYGTLNELILFTEIVERWDIAAAELLPDYMKTCFKALNNITNEISNKVYKEQGWNPVDSLRKTWASLCNAFLVEAKWFASGKLPNADEYLENGIVSSGVHVLLVHIFFLLGEGITKENVELIDSNPGIISSTATILRLWDDLGSAKDESQDGRDGSYVECYMKENKGSSVEDARNRVHFMISEAWKQLNQECLSPNPFSSTFSKSSLNIARMVPLMYSYDDNHCLPNLEEHVKSLLYENASSQI